MEAPLISVGIMTEQTVVYVLNEEYVCRETGATLTGEQCASFAGGCIVFRGKQYGRLSFEPLSHTASFELKAVTIGVDFHWQRREDQRFRGALNLIAVEKGILVINRIDVEEYLISVISSEMSATASTEFLKAHAVISRSWLLAQIIKRQRLDGMAKTVYQTVHSTDKEFIRWYDREDHDLFDVCADDHCQRYQGITRAASSAVQDVIRATEGEVLMSGKDICDARFSKCCGGITEKFEHVWEPTPHAYLTALRDGGEGTDFPDLTVEEEADRWIRTAPPAFCNTHDRAILSQALNNYDRETTDFYRWKVVYPQAQLAELIRRKSGMDFGDIIDLIPLQRGSSGRICKLEVAGSRLTCTIGKELEIRRILSDTHLYSAAFVVDRESVENGLPGRFVLTGAGWGHGVGLCQIGAAVMGAQGYDYRRILTHYYPGAAIEKQY
jgi:SpoIID/LytB domain protein